MMEAHSSFRKSYRRGLRSESAISTSSRFPRGESATRSRETKCLRWPGRSIEVHRICLCIQTLLQELSDPVGPSAVLKRTAARFEALSEIRQMTVGCLLTTQMTGSDSAIYFVID